MTAIQIKYLEYLENKRKNLANEALTASQIQVEREKLAEVIANNLRTHRVNVTKNEITRLANNQLNKREVAKLSETIRSNLSQENLRLQDLIEDQRSHMASEKIKQYEADIKNNQMLIDSLNSGKSQDLTGKLFDWFRGAINADLMSGGQVLDKTGGTSLHRGKQISNALDYITSNNIIAKMVGDAKLIEDPTPRAYREPKTKAYRQVEREKDVDEKPMDFSNSKGPGHIPDVLGANPSNTTVTKGRQIYESPIGPQLPTNKVASVTPPSLVVSNVTPQTSAVNPVSVKSNSGSAVIYSPGSKVGPGWL